MHFYFFSKSKSGRLHYHFISSLLLFPLQLSSSPLFLPLHNPVEVNPLLTPSLPGVAPHRAQRSAQPELKIDRVAVHVNSKPDFLERPEQRPAERVNPNEENVLAGSGLL